MIPMWRKCCCLLFVVEFLQGLIRKRKIILGFVILKSPNERSLHFNKLISKFEPVFEVGLRYDDNGAVFEAFVLKMNELSLNKRFYFKVIWLNFVNLIRFLGKLIQSSRFRIKPIYQKLRSILNFEKILNFFDFRSCFL